MKETKQHLVTIFLAESLELHLPGPGTSLRPSPQAPRREEFPVSPSRASQLTHHSPSSSRQHPALSPQVLSL